MYVVEASGNLRAAKRKFCKIISAKLGVCGGEDSGTLLHFILLIIVAI